MFTTMAPASFSSGALVSGPGWATMNYTVLSLLIPVVLAVVWYLRTPGGARARASV